MLTKRYMASVKNLSDIMKQIVKGTAPENFNYGHLKGLGFTSSNDRAIIPLLKDLGFLTDSGVPTERYHAYRSDTRSKAVLGEALLDAYSDLFHVNASPSDRDRDAIKGKFKSAHNATDRIAEAQTSTFYALLKLADIEAGRSGKGFVPPAVLKATKEEDKSPAKESQQQTPLQLRYNIQVHLPATKDVDVYNAIFKALKEHLA